jgi:U4/U6 small nuclear ribonucleoprotein PRP4
MSRPPEGRRGAGRSARGCPGAAEPRGGGPAGRVWDLRSGRSIMVLEGHVKMLLALDFSPCGRLLASGSEDHSARVWDLRQRRCLHTLPGHRSLVSQARRARPARAPHARLAARRCALSTPAQLFCAAPQQRQLSMREAPRTSRATACAARCEPQKKWPALCRRLACTPPRHRMRHRQLGAVRRPRARARAQVRFEPSDGHVLLTAGYDATAKLWDARDWRLVRTLAGHEGRVMGADLAPDGSGAAATVAYDRTLKLWAPEDPPPEQP